MISENKDNALAKINSTDEEINLLEEYRNRKRTLEITNKVNSKDGYYEIEKMVFKKNDDNLIQVSTSHSSYSDFSFALGRRTGEYSSRGSHGFFTTILNKDDIDSLIDFLQSIK